MKLFLGILELLAELLSAIWSISRHILIAEREDMIFAFIPQAISRYFALLSNISAPMDFNAVGAQLPFS